MAGPLSLTYEESIHLSENISSVDVENNVAGDVDLQNAIVRNFAWQNITITVKDRKTNSLKTLLRDVSGIVRAGMLI
jgi:hypothetical protein